FELAQNYPNPFNPTTTISFTLPTPGDVTLEVFNVLGQRVAVLASGPYGAGTHHVEWNASGVSSGVYLYRLSAGEFTETRKMLLVK
ncbi:MAG TPA: T9SS type A sorting domain-containing protein, partial [candidate division Zixibacteria bacterium]|nr:T9SS type A sorting domain-containing protein [candidate division Zixibacteria bacterium]